MNNFKQSGDVVTLTAPSGGVVAGNGYKIGQLFVVATNTVAEGLPFEGQVTGVVSLTKAVDETAWTEGQLLYWDDTGKDVVEADSGNLLIGVAVEATAALATTGLVRLNGIARADEA